MKKLAIIVTHPIQYYVPLFQRLQQYCALKVFYTWGIGGAESKYDPDFKQVINWDLPLKDGYTYEFLPNTAKEAGSHHFLGIKNPTIIHQIEEFKPTAILIFGWAYHSHLRVMRYFNGKIPIWFRGDSTLINEKNGIKKTLRHLFLTWIYQYVDKAFYVGTANQNYFKAFGLKQNQLVFAPHAVDNDRFAKDRSQEATKLRQQFGIATDEILILFAGKLEAKKNPKLLLQAFLELNLAGVHLLFVGNGEFEGELKKMKDASTSLCMTNVHFMNFQNQQQMPVIYQACDLFCLPSEGPGETWGLAVNEAMACGKAVLVSDHCGCAQDLVVIGKNGDIFQSNNLRDLSQKLTLLLSDQQKLKTMGSYSTLLIKEWTINKQCESLLNELEKL